MADDLLGRLNSATKYPSILTYHPLDPKNGKLLDEDPVHYWQGRVTLTEKVNGTSGRVVVMPDGDWFIGSREELLYARGDRIVNPNLGIVPALLELAPTLQASGHMIRVYFFEVYGYRIGPAAKQYTREAQAVGYRLFDAAQVKPDVLGMIRSDIAGWRDRGGPLFFDEGQLLSTSEVHGSLPLVPRIATVDAGDLPTDLLGTAHWLDTMLPETQVRLDETGGGKAEGIVLRTQDRSLIAKARFEDYERTLKETGGKR